MRNQSVIFTWTASLSCSVPVLACVKLPGEYNSEPGSLVCTTALERAAKLAPPSASWALHCVEESAISGGRPSTPRSSTRVAGGGSGGIPAAAGLIQEEIDFHSALGAPGNARTFGARCIQRPTHMRQTRSALLAAGQSAGPCRIAGGGGVQWEEEAFSVQGSLRACCAASELHQVHVLADLDGLSVAA
ncbi:hypothetical protein TcBrA4_0092150 [Trypanosoma cruzi]|nr:hypothetical protein TcBrA4_0092150 [Trypanosoma cruzi]